MISVQRSEDRFRGGDEAAGIETRHAFSFGSFYDPDNVRFGPVVACNEERLAPGAGFDEHPHSHTEIVTWVVEGELTHRDSTGRATVVRPGGLQHLSAAAGVRHVERNDRDRPLTFIQMWLTPLEPGGDPAYTTLPELADDTPYAVPAAGAGLHVRRLAAGERAAVPDAARVYVHVVAGTVRIGDEEGPELGVGDAARITGETGLGLTATAGPTEEEPAEVLIWELPA
ncbi:pirin family protein [Streptomyces sp. NPDC002476]|uniref:pirin family protein n=1 Tax=Streptomyces sp. NPDC002476 TaxID=3364648 RepID=UPI0036CCCDD4